MLKVDWLKVLGLAKKNWKEITIIILLLTVIGKMRYDYKQLENTYEASQAISSKSDRRFASDSY